VLVDCHHAMSKKSANGTAWLQLVRIFSRVDKFIDHLQGLLLLICNFFVFGVIIIWNLVLAFFLGFLLS
jgi:hypothetical protein